MALKREEIDQSSSLYTNGGDWLAALEGIIKAAKADVLIEEEKVLPRSEMTLITVKKVSRIEHLSDLNFPQFES